MSKIKSDHQLPTLAGLHTDDETAYQHNELLKYLNQPPHIGWIKEHETVKIKVNGVFKPLKYLPIDKVRFLLTRIFGLFWHDEIVSYGTNFNSCTVHVRLHYCIPGTDIWLYKDGIGSVGVQTDKDAAAADLLKIKSNAVMLAMPAAASYALSNAAEKLGCLFGENLNKWDAVQYVGMEQIGKGIDTAVNTVASQNQQAYQQQQSPQFLPNAYGQQQAYQQQPQQAYQQQPVAQPQFAQAFPQQAVGQPVGQAFPQQAVNNSFTFNPAAL